LASGEGRFQCSADRPDRHIVKVEPVAVAGFQRLKMKMLGGDFQQQGFDGGLGLCGHGGISGGELHRFRKIRIALTRSVIN
jgi:hypothetical protein